MKKSGEASNVTETLYFSKGKMILYRSLFWIGAAFFVYAAVVENELYYWMIPTNLRYALNWRPVLLIVGFALALFAFLGHRKQFMCKTFCCKGILHNAAGKFYSLQMKYDEEYCSRCGQKYRVLPEMKQPAREGKAQSV